MSQATRKVIPWMKGRVIPWMKGRARHWLIKGLSLHEIVQEIVLVSDRDSCDGVCFSSLSAWKHGV